MLIFHRDCMTISDMSYSKMICEATKRSATESIAKFILEITSIKNEFQTDPDLKQETRVLNDVINNLIRVWSDSSSNICSSTAHKFVEMGLSFNGKGRRSNNVKYSNWVSKRQKEMNEDRNIESAKKLVFAIAHSCVSNKNDSRYTTLSKLNDECKKSNIQLNMSDYSSIKLTLDDMTINTINRLVSDGRFNKNPMYFEHFIPVDDVKKRIYSLVDEKKLNYEDMLNEIEHSLSGMVTCWTTVYENSKIKNATGRNDPWQSYADAGITLCTRDGNIIKSKKDLGLLI